MFAIELHNITKSYDHKPALNGITLQVEQGELFGLIGPDGAGKTSIFRILTTLILPDQGDAWVTGLHIEKDYKDIRKSVGYMPGRFSLYQDLSVQENLNFFASVYGSDFETNYNLIRDIYIQLEPFKHRKAGALSGGMKQKLALCCALIHRPTVLFLDEPTTGVDAVSRREFWQILKRLKQEGITIFVSTPYMEEANQCERIALIQEGELLSVDTPQGIIDQYPHPLFSIASENMPSLLRSLRNRNDILSCNGFGDALHVTLHDENNTDILMQELINEGHSVAPIKAIEPTIEDCFIHLMQK